MRLRAENPKLPTPEEALPGRQERLSVAGRHFVLDSPLQGKFEGKQLAMFGLGCFWGAERIYWQLPGVHTILGVSNVSFGLSPAARAVLNSVFLHHCVEAGLDMAIVNPALAVALPLQPNGKSCRKRRCQQQCRNEVRHYDLRGVFYPPTARLHCSHALNGKETKEYAHQQEIENPAVKADHGFTPSRRVKQLSQPPCRICGSPGAT